MRLGATDLTVSRIGFGCAAIGGFDYGRADDEASIAAVRRALELGITLFDAADVYGLGHAESVLGRALGEARRDVVIATKVGVRWNSSGHTWRDLDPAWIAEAVDGSLRRLGVEQIALYQIHWPDGRTPIDDVMAALERCREMGKIRHIGCCNFAPELIRDAQRAARLESLQSPYSLLEPHARPAIVEASEVFGMTVLAYNVLARGLLTGKYDASSRFSGTDTRRHSRLFDGATLRAGLALVERLRVVGDARARTPAQVAMRWALDQREIGVALAGMRTPSQVDDNVAATGWRLGDAELRFLHAGAPPPVANRG